VARSRSRAYTIGPNGRPVPQTRLPVAIRQRLKRRTFTTTLVKTEIVFRLPNGTDIHPRHATNTLPTAVPGECGLDVAFKCEVFQITAAGRGLNSRPVSGFSAADPIKRVEDMFHRALRAISPILDGMLGLPGITILALLGCIGMGLAIARIDLPKTPLWQAATSTAGQSRDWVDYDQRYTSGRYVAGWWQTAQNARTCHLSHI
jgi:hypothetical protein